MEKRIFIVQKKNLESKAIVDMLRSAGEEYMITEQKGIATWDGMEEEIKDFIESNTAYLIYGVEIEGDCPACCVELSWREVKKPIKNEVQTSIEVVSELLNIPLSIGTRFVAANERYYIDGIKDLCKELGYSEERTKAVVDEIRSTDRKAQGITMDMEMEAIAALENKKVYGDLTVIYLHHDQFASITDRIYGTYKSLMIVSPEKVGVFGDGYLCIQLYDMFGGKKAGNLPQEGFYINTECVSKVEEFVIKRYNK